MIKELKKKLFYLLCLQRKNFIGKTLGSLAKSITHALDNKINDGTLSGEYWFLKNLNHSEIKVVFDVGSNVGNWSKKVLESISDAQIHAFEPVPNTFELLETNIRDFQQIKRNRLGLSSESGKLKFNFYPNSSYLSSAFEHYLGQGAERLEVDVMRGDEYCKTHQLSQIDFLKIDTEGFESKVLMGFSAMFAENRIKLVQFEYGPMAIDSKFLLADFYEFFEARGFQVGKIYPNWIDFKAYSKDMENFVLSNFIACKKDALSCINYKDV
jgi:FkbM family methyltransferase